MPQTDDHGSERFSDLLVVISPEAMTALLELEPGFGTPVLTDGAGRYFPRLDERSPSE